MFDDLSFRLSKDFHVDHASILLSACLPNKTTTCSEIGTAETPYPCDLTVDSSTALLWFRQKELLQMLSARAAQGFSPLAIKDTSKNIICKGNFNDSGTTAAYVGVPLRLPNTTSFGYICLAHRQARHWHNREIAFLSQLASALTEEVSLRLTLDHRTAHDSARFMRFYNLLLQANDLATSPTSKPDVTGNEAQNNRVNQVLNWLMAQSASIFNANHGFAYFAVSELATAENHTQAGMQTLASLSLDELENSPIEELMQKALPPRNNGANASAPISVSHQAAIGSFQVYLPRSIQVQVGKGLSGQIWRDRIPVIVEDYEKWNGRTVWIEKGRVRAMAGVPINVHNNICGVVGIGYADERRFKNADLTGLTRLANMAALALP
ncbi:MAG: GAF domain-containing protein [Anaerolineae bacterium]|nr:GAF domain-containing protein [Anaerolineae bacterium]